MTFIVDRDEKRFSGFVLFFFFLILMKQKECLEEH